VRPGRWAVGASLLVVVAVVGVAGLTIAGGVSVQHLPYQSEFCFAEWCVTPTTYVPGTNVARVAVHVRSDAKAASQRPDHPQAWLTASGVLAGGPQTDLDRLIGPGESYDTTLAFSIRSAGTCPRLQMSEGAWPSFLGLGYTPSPFSERVDWPLCP
jgi:hypothetical protein